MPNDARARPVAVVTGASSGIGLAIAQTLVKQGGSVCGLSRQAPADGSDPAFTHRRPDLGDRAATEAMARELAGAGALVHAAGVLRVGSLGQLDAGASGHMWRRARLAAASTPPPRRRWSPWPAVGRLTWWGRA